MSRIKQEVARYLDREYRAWMDREGSRKDLRDFAKYLGLPLSTLSELMDPDNRRLPGKSNRDKIAVTLGSNEINDIMGAPHNIMADPEMAEFVHEIRNLSKEERDLLKKQIKFLAKEARAQRAMPLGT